jgi:hypothetical protein
MAAHAGFAPARFRLTGGGTTVIRVSRVSSFCEIWSPRQELHLRSPGPRPGMLLLHYAVLPRLVLGKEAGGLVLCGHEASQFPGHCRRVGDLLRYLGLWIYDLAGRSGAAPDKLSFGDSTAQAGARPFDAELRVQSGKFALLTSTLNWALKWCGCRESHPDILPGEKTFCC